MINLNNWQPSDGLILEPNALSAAKEISSNLVLTAGPGAGKTEMLAQRADFLLRTGTSPYPKRILAISFKVDASTNLKARVKKRCGNQLGSRFDSYTFHAFAKKIIDQFRVVLTGIDALNPNYTIGDTRIEREQITFQDLVPLAIQILQSSTVALKAVRCTYSDVFLDEFQDCTSVQYDLIKVAFKDTDVRLTAVGDVKQRIMGWAGALDGIFATYSQEFSAIELVLYRNFRSKPQILRVQNTIIEFMDPASAMNANDVEGDEGFVSLQEFETSDQEAEFLADYIENLVSLQGVPKSEIAVLVKSQIHLYTFELMSALEERGIAYRNEQDLQDLSSQPIAKLIIDFLLVVLGRKEPSSWERLMNTITPFYDAEKQQKEQMRWLKIFKNTKVDIKHLVEISTPSFSDIWNHVSSFLDNVSETTIKSLSPEYESSARVAELVDEIKTRLDELFLSSQDLYEATKRFIDDDAVRLLTIHKSKGLEFDTVILQGIENQTYWGNPLENLSAFFVGVSRAKRNLLLTCSSDRTRPEGHSGVWHSERVRQAQYTEFVEPYINT